MQSFLPMKDPCTSEIIGVQHVRGIERAVMDYLDRKYPSLQNLMLELPPGYDVLKSHKLAPPFFTKLADYYQERGVRIIPGDRLYWNQYCLSGEEVVEAVEKNGRAGFRALCREGKRRREEAIKKINEEIDREDGWWVDFGWCLERIMHDRNRDMHKLFRKENPEVSVMGGGHARYLKQRNPAVYFSYFTPYTKTRKTAGAQTEVDALHLVRLRMLEKFLNWARP